MSLDSSRVLELVLDKLRVRPSRTLPVDDELRKGLQSNIAKGMNEAFEQVKSRGKELAFHVLGIDTTWRDWKFKDNTDFYASIKTELKPYTNKLAKELIAELNPNDFKLTKTRQKQLVQRLRNDYETAIEQAVRDHFRDEIVAKAKADVAAMWEHMPTILGDGKTLEDVVADHFTAMIAQDSDLAFEQEQERLEHVRDYMVSHAEMLYFEERYRDR